MNYWKYIYQTVCLCVCEYVCVCARVSVLMCVCLCLYRACIIMALIVEIPVYVTFAKMTQCVQVSSVTTYFRNINSHHV